MNSGDESTLTYTPAIGRHSTLPARDAREPGSPTVSLVRPSVMVGKRREKQTLIPAFDPELLAKELEAQTDRPTITPPYDPSSYARIVDNHVEGSGARSADGHDTPRTITAATPSALGGPGGMGGVGGLAESAIDSEATGTIGRAMYGSYLQSDYPEALVLAERVLEREPDHALARLVAQGCLEKLGEPEEPARLAASSVVRLKRPAHEIAGFVDRSDTTSQFVLGHVDGVADVAMLAELSGIPRHETLDRLHALLDLGLLEVVRTGT